MVDTYKNRVHVDCLSGGTANLTLGAAISTAYQSFSAGGIGDGDTFPYTAYTSTQFECAHGAYSAAGPTLVRTAGNVVAGSAGAGALTNFSSNPRVFLGPLAEDWPTSGTPGGSDTQVQYNDGGAFGGDAGLVFNESTNVLTITGSGNAGSTSPLHVLPSSGASFTKILDNGAVMIDADTATGTNPLVIKYAGSEIFRVIYAAQVYVDPTGLNPNSQLNVGGGKIVVAGGSSGSIYFEIIESSAPAAPASNAVRIFAEDNGSGKTRLMARFPTGANVQIAIEP